MTTGRINQITRWGAPPGRAPTPGPKHQREVPPGRAHNPRGGQSVYQEGTPEGARPRRQPRRTGDDIDDHPIAPTKPLSTGPHAGVQRPGPPLRAGGGCCGIRPSGGGSDPVDDAGERRFPQGGSLQESLRQAWSATIHPQTPAVPGTKGPPGFGHHPPGTLRYYGTPVATKPRPPDDPPRTQRQHLAS